MSNSEAAEMIAEHFSKVRRNFSPLQQESLPTSVIQNIENPGSESEILKSLNTLLLKQSAKPLSLNLGSLEICLENWCLSLGQNFPVTKIFSS